MTGAEATVADVEAVEPPSAVKDTSTYFCQACGVGLGTGKAGEARKWCAQHKPQRSHHKIGGEYHRPSSPAASSSEGPSEKKPSGHGASEAQWFRFSVVVLLTASYLLARFAAGGQGLLLRPPAGVADAELAAATEALSMETDEAEPVAKLIAARITPTALNKRFGTHIVTALEYEDAVEALWAYAKRVGPPLVFRLSGATPPPPPPPAPINVRVKASTNGSTRQDQSNAAVVAAFRASQGRHPTNFGRNDEPA
jgi:hypothetical protein